MTVELFNQEFEDIVGQLKSYILRITASIEDAEDIVHDTYLKALDKLHTFRGDSTLKTWLFTIASNVAKDNLRAKRRWPMNAMDLARQESIKHPEIYIARFVEINSTSPDGMFELREHIHFCFTCIGKSLPIEQQLAILLKEVFEFKVVEISLILETTDGVVKHLLINARKTMVNVFEQRCSLINKSGVCHQCSELSGLFNPKQDFHQNHIKTRLENEANDKSKESLFNLRLNIAKAIDPATCKGKELQTFHFEHIDNVVSKNIQ